MLAVVMVACLWTACADDDGDGRATDDPSFDIDRPTYLDAQECGESALRLIQQEQLPTSSVHRCETEERNVSNSDVDFVTIKYGIPEDCESGCIYSGISAVVTDDLVDTVPFNDHNLVLLGDFLAEPPFASRTVAENPDEATVDIELVYRGGQYGWHFTLKVPIGGKTGSAFYYLNDDGSPGWDFSGLRDAATPTQ